MTSLNLSHQKYRASDLCCVVIFRQDLLVYWLLILDSQKPQREYNIPILTGSAYVGQLYDAKNGQLLHDRFLWNNPIAVNEAKITSVESETYIEESIRDRLSHMSFSAEISATIFELITVTFGKVFKISECIIPE